MEAKMRFTLFRIGWSLVFLSSIIAFQVSPRLDDKLAVAFFAVITISLLRKAEFPEREVALSISWFGALLLTLWTIAYYYYFNPTFENAANVALPTSATIATMRSSLLWRFFVQGCIETVLMIWFSFGYGYILILSFFATILPKKFHAKLWHKHALDDYKPHQKKWLWVIVGLYFILKMFLVIGLAWTIKQ